MGNEQSRFQSAAAPRPQRLRFGARFGRTRRPAEPSCRLNEDYSAERLAAKRAGLGGLGAVLRLAGHGAAARRERR